MRAERGDDAVVRVEIEGVLPGPGLVVCAVEVDGGADGDVVRGPLLLQGEDLRQLDLVGVALGGDPGAVDDPAFTDRRS